MTASIVQSAAICMLATSALPADAADCTIEGGPGAVIEALNKAPTCRAAYGVLEACSWGSSQDVAFATVVVAKCEAEFPATMSARAKTAYVRAKEKCRTKYARQQGTMYVSFSALCAATLATTDVGAKK